MSVSQTVVRQTSGDLSASINASVTVSGGAGLVVSENCAQSATTTVNVVVDQSAVKHIFVNLNKAGTIVAKASGGGTINTWTMLANQPICWATGDPVACPLSNDIATMEVTLGAVGSAGADLTVVVIQDPTP